jgi:ArsR family transcriptional regulator
MKRVSKNNQVSEQLAVLSDPLRLRLLHLLERQELSVGELARVVQLPQSTVSRHLKVLSDSAWLVNRAEGTSTLYRMVLDELSPGPRELWMTVRDQIEGASEHEADARRLHLVLAERRTDTKAFFGRVAGEWDAVRDALFGREFMPAALLNLLLRDWVVADLGCGTGNASEFLAPVVREVIAVDQSRPMLDAAAKRLGAFKNVRFVEGELEKLPLHSGSVDAAVIVLVLHHVNDPQKALSEMRRILKPGGIALVVDMMEHDRGEYKQTMGHRWLGFGEDLITDMAKRAGLVSPRFTPVATEVDAKGPGLFALTAFAPSGKEADRM